MTSKHSRIEWDCSFSYWRCLGLAHSHHSTSLPVNESCSFENVQMDTTPQSPTSLQRYQPPNIELTTGHLRYHPTSSFTTACNGCNYLPYGRPGFRMGRIRFLPARPRALQSHFGGIMSVHRHHFPGIRSRKSHRQSSNAILSALR